MESTCSMEERNYHEAADTMTSCEVMEMPRTKHEQLLQDQGRYRSLLEQHHRQHEARTELKALEHHVKSLERQVMDLKARNDHGCRSVLSSIGAKKNNITSSSAASSIRRMQRALSIHYARLRNAKRETQVWTERSDYCDKVMTLMDGEEKRRQRFLHVVRQWHKLYSTTDEVIANATVTPQSTAPVILATVVSHDEDDESVPKLTDEESSLGERRRTIRWANEWWYHTIPSRSCLRKQLEAYEKDEAASVPEKSDVVSVSRDEYERLMMVQTNLSQLQRYEEDDDPLNEDDAQDYKEQLEERQTQLEADMEMLQVHLGELHRAHDYFVSNDNSSSTITAVLRFWDERVKRSMDREQTEQARLQQEVYWKKNSILNRKRCMDSEWWWYHNQNKVQQEQQPPCTPELSKQLLTTLSDEPMASSATTVLSQ